MFFFVGCSDLRQFYGSAPSSPPRRAADPDATDGALTTSFGAAHLVRFDVHTDEVTEAPDTLARAA
ncbi:hypothetical protein CCS92_16635 [Methylobacterium radiotolerans]|nr:hypothetical protein CCS92_16635 [Methylobacterium radiotolerans]